MSAGTRFAILTAATLVLVASVACFVLLRDNLPAGGSFAEDSPEFSAETAEGESGRQPSTTVPGWDATPASHATPAAGSTTYRLSGVVVDEAETPQPGIQVRLTRWHSGAPVVRADAVSDAEGRFEVDGLIEGNYAATLARPGTTNASTEVAGTKYVGPDEELTNARFYFKERTGPGIAGIVLDGNGEPVGGAVVLIEGESRNRKPHGAITNPDGRFNVGGLVQGRYVVGAYHPGYFKANGIEVIAPASNVGVVLQPLAAIEGRVIDDENGAPITAFRIGARHMSWPAELAGTLVDELRPHADSAGEFRLEVGTGQNWIVVHAEGYVPVVHTAPVVAPGAIVEGLEIRLQPGTVVTGTVRDMNGNPIPDVHMSYLVHYTEHPDRPPKAVGRATTDLAGRFQLDSVGHAEAEIMANHPEYVPKTQRVTPARGVPAILDFVLESGGVIEGYVLIAGQPAVNLTAEVRGTGHHKIVRTNNSGAFTFTGLANGAHVVSVSGSTGPETPIVSARKPVDVIAGQSKRADFAFAAGTATIEAVVLRNGELVDDAHVRASFTGNDSGFRQNWVARRQDGVYRIDELPEGKVTIGVHAPDEDEYLRTRYVQVHAIADETTRVEMELGGGARITGTITGLREGSQYEIAAYRGIVPIESEYGEAVVSSDGPIAGSCLPLDNSFSITGLEPGTYTVVVTLTDESGPIPLPMAREVVEVGDGDVARIVLPLQVTD